MITCYLLILSRYTHTLHHLMSIYHEFCLSLWILTMNQTCSTQRNKVLFCSVPIQIRMQVPHVQSNSGVSPVLIRVLCLTKAAKGLFLSQTTNFRLFQTERVCRWQFHIRWKCKDVVQIGRKHCWKKRNCSLRAISRYEQFLLFPHCFQKACTADT